MGPKRQRKDSSSSSTRAFDRRKFVSAEAAEKFDSFAGRSLAQERGLRPSPEDGEMLLMIQNKGWYTFTEHPASACIAIVKEFYANATDTPERTVMVRGKVVSYSRDRINTYYQLPGYDNCQYSSFRPDYEHIVQELCRPGTEWKRNTLNGRVKSFSANTLSRYAKIWYAFICAKLLPSKHVNDVTWDRVGLLYAIITNLNIDVGRVIASSIAKRIEGGTSGGFPHPSLITELCRQAGVTWSSSELLQPPTTLLDHQLIQRYVVWNGGQSHPRGLGFTIPQDDAAPGPSSAPDSSTAVDPPPVDHISLSALSAQIERIQRRMDREHRRASARQHTVTGQLLRLSQRQMQMMFHFGATQDAWITYFSGLHPNADMSHFPTVPTLRTFPPEPTTDDEESLNTSDASDDDDAADT